MSDSDSSRDYDLLDRLVDEFNERFRRGERPSLKEYFDRYPHLAEDLRELLPAMAQVEQAKGEMGDGGAGAAVSVKPAIQSLGDYRILREVGHGGMGVVYEAEQLSLGRRVALKVLTDRLLREPKQKQRFEREARAAARLHHTNIVPVFGTGEADGIPYYIMQFIQGMGLDVVVAELASLAPGTAAAGLSPDRPRPTMCAASQFARSLLTGEFRPAADGQPQAGAGDPTQAAGAPSPDLAVHSSNGPAHRSTDTSGLSSSISLPGRTGSGGKSRRLGYWQSAARVGVQVADALDYAHQQGVIHRDIKPSNLLLDLAGTVWVTDFGLAKAEGADNLTHTGDVLGTLRYMPPEAFDGKADLRGDVYSLGLTLYELVALRPAYDETDRNRLVKQVTVGEPRPLGRARPGVPRDLETIIAKATDKEPSRRYQTAGALRDDLQRFVDDEPILARRQTPLESYLRWARHNPGIAVLGVVLAAVLVLATVVSLLVAGRMTTLAQNEVNAAREERQARREAEEAKEKEAKLRTQAEQAQQDAEAAKAKAEKNFAKARAAVDDYLTKVSENRLLKVPGMQELRRELLVAALGFYEEFLHERKHDSSIRAGLADAYRRVGKIRSDLGEEKPSRDSYEQAFRLYEALVEAAPHDVEARHGLADCHYYLKRYQEAVAIWEGLIRPGQPRFLKELAQIYTVMATVDGKNSRPDVALAAHQKALACWERLLKLAPESTDHHFGLSISLNNIAVILTNKGQEADGLALYRRSVALVEGILQKESPDSEMLVGHSIQLVNLAHSEQRLGHKEEALAHLRSGLQASRRAARENPRAWPCQHSYLRTGAMFIQLLATLGQGEEAGKLARELREAAALPTDRPEQSVDLAAVHTRLAEVVRRNQQSLRGVEPAEVDRLLEAAVANLKRAIAGGYRDTAKLRVDKDLAPLLKREEVKELLSQADRLGKAEADASAEGPPEKKLAAAEAVLKAQQVLSAADPLGRRIRADQAAAHHAIGLLQLQLGRTDEARPALEKALTMRRELCAEQPREEKASADLDASELALGDVDWKTGRLVEAVKRWNSYREARAAEPAGPLQKGQLAALTAAIGDRYIEYGLWAEAADCYRSTWSLETRPRLTTGAKLAYLLHSSGDRAGYETLRSELVERFAAVTDMEDAGRLLLAVCLGANPPPGLEPVIAVLEQVVVADGSDVIRRRRAFDGLLLAHYRKGKHADVERVYQGIKSLGSERTLSRLLRGLAMVQQDPTGPGRAWLADVLGHHHEFQAAVATDSPIFPMPLGREWDIVQTYRVLAAEPAALALAPASTNLDLAFRLHSARTYQRLGEGAKAALQLRGAVEAQPDIPEVWLLCGRTYGELGLREEAATALARAKTLADELRADPLTEPGPAARLANYLLAVRARETWSVLRPAEVASTGGSTLRVLPDDSVLATGKNPEGDTYTFVAELPPGPVSAIRIEMLPDPRLPHGGHGRYQSNGNYTLSEVTVQLDGRAVRPRALADCTQPHPPDHAIDERLETFWNSRARFREPAHLVLVFKEPAAARQLKLRLVSHSQPWSHHNVGRFRVSATTVSAEQVERLASLDLSRLDAHGRLAAVLLESGQEAPRVAAFLARALGDSAAASLCQLAAGNDAVFTELVRLRPADYQLWAARGQRLAAAGDVSSTAAFVRVRELLDERLKAPVERTEEAARLGTSLWQAAERTLWTMVRPDKVVSTDGTTLTILPDDSVLASGLNPDWDIYTVELPVPTGTITALRLEALPDRSLPHAGSGRFPGNGNFLLSEVVVSAEGRALRVAAAFADYAGPAQQPASVLDGQRHTSWDPWPHHREPRQLVLILAEPLEARAAARLTVRLESQFNSWKGSNLGRFRLAVTSAPVDRLRVLEHRWTAATSESEDGWMQLGAATALLGHDPAKAATFLLRGLEAKGTERVLRARAAAAAPEAVFSELTKLHGGDLDLWLARGRWLAEIGEPAGADDAFAAAVRLTPHELNRFVAAGWWAIGPYAADPQLTAANAVENAPSPSEAHSSLGGSGLTKWRYAPSDQGGRVRLRPLVHERDNASAYALSHVWSPEERKTALLIGGWDAVRVWLNGESVFAETTRGRHDAPVSLARIPVTLRAGRNTLLVKVSSAGESWFIVRIADNALDRGQLRASLAQWSAAALEWAKIPEQAPSGYYQVQRLHALLLLHAGDQDGFRRHLAQRIEPLRSSTSKHAAYTEAFVKTLSPEPSPEADRLVSRARRADAVWKLADTRVLVGLAEYRAGRFEQAEATLTGSALDELPKTWVVRALALYRLGKQDEARQQLKRATKWYDEAVRDSKDTTLPWPKQAVWWDGLQTSWGQLVQFQILYLEARRLIDGAEATDLNRAVLEKRGRELLQQREAY